MSHLIGVKKISLYNLQISKTKSKVIPS